MKSYIVCCIGALQGAEGIVVQAIGAGKHALEYVRKGWAGYRLTAGLLPLTSPQALHL